VSFFGFLGPNGRRKNYYHQNEFVWFICSDIGASILVNDYDIVQAGRWKAKQSIAYVPDIPFLYEKLTGRGVSLLYWRTVQDSKINIA